MWVASGCRYHPEANANTLMMAGCSGMIITCCDTPCLQRKWRIAPLNALIYGLIDPRNEELRYVGRTTNTLKKRWKEHIRDAKDLRDTAPRFAWIRELLSLGLQPEIFLIEEVTQDDMREAEGAWMAYFRYIGARLLNVPYRNGNEGAKYRDFDWTPEIIAKLGTVPDDVLAKELGLSSRRIIERKRHNLGISKCGPGRALYLHQWVDGTALNCRSISLRAWGQCRIVSYAKKSASQSMSSSEQGKRGVSLITLLLIVIQRNSKMANVLCAGTGQGHASNFHGTSLIDLEKSLMQNLPEKSA
jgi:hypothetical protein